LSIFDEATKKKVVPKVIEPTFGMDRAFLAVLVDAYNYDKERGNVVLKVNPKLAPVKIGVFPLVNKEKIPELSADVFNSLKRDFTAQYDKSGSIGRRYARADEIGIPYCLTIDFDSLKNKDATIRDRDTTEQVRVKISELKDVLRKLVSGEITFSSLKK